MKTTVVSTLTALSAWPAWRVAYTAPAISAVWIVSETKPVRKILLSLLRPDSISTSNTGQPPNRNVLLILPRGPHPLVAAALQNDDRKVRPALPGLWRPRIARAASPGGLPGQGDRERRPPPRAAHDVDLAAVRLRDPLADREPESCARPLAGAGAGRVGPPKAIEDVRQVAGRDPDAGVGNAEGHSPMPVRKGRDVLLPQLDLHAAALGRVLHGVGQQVQDQLADAALVHGHDDWLGRRAHLHLHAGLLGQELARLARLGHDAAQVHRLLVERRDPFVRARQRQQRVDELG